MLKRRLVPFLMALVLLVTILPFIPNSASADTVINQSGPNPLVFNQTATTDNVVFLMAGSAKRNSGMTVYNLGQPKHGWITGFNDNTNDYFEWTVSLPSAAVYHVDAILNSTASTALRLTVNGTSNVLNFTASNIGWDKKDAGTISIPAGTSTLRLVRNTTATNNIELKSLELVRNSDYPAYLSRISSFRKDTTWLANSNYGVMFQYGHWGYPQSGGKKSLEAQANDFNVTNFVNMVKGTGAKYVIWSTSWFTYELNAPITAIDNIIGNGNRTSSRDLIGDVATALKAEGIRFMLYYHMGHDAQLGYNSTDFWQAQNWPTSFSGTGTGDRSTFFNNWETIIREMGNRYGTKLDGWLFDDAMSYYPAPFERLGAAARAGNSNRLISYNNWISARYTDFQDVSFGEDHHGQAVNGSAGVGGNGIFVSGKYKGLLEFGNFTMEQDWGVSQQNQPINTHVTASEAIGWVTSAKARHVPLSFNMMMWENGTVSSASLNALTALKNAIYPSGPVYRIKNRTSGDVLNGGGTTDGYAVTTWTDGSSTNLQWEVIDLGNGYFKIKNRTNGRVLNGGGASSGAIVSEWSDVTSNNLQWQKIDAGGGYFKFKNRTSGRMLSAGGTADGAAVTEVTDSTSNNLQWQLIVN